MGKITGFLEYEREDRDDKPVATRAVWLPFAVVAAVALTGVPAEACWPRQMPSIELLRQVPAGAYAFIGELVAVNWDEGEPRGVPHAGITATFRVLKSFADPIRGLVPVRYENCDEPMTLVGHPGHVMAIRTERGLVAISGIEYFKSVR